MTNENKSDWDKRVAGVEVLKTELDFLPDTLEAAQFRVEMFGKAYGESEAKASWDMYLTGWCDGIAHSDKQTALQLGVVESRLLEVSADIVSRLKVSDDASDKKMKAYQDESLALRQEVEVLRKYGNKNCTELADEKLNELRHPAIDKATFGEQARVGHSVDCDCPDEVKDAIDSHMTKRNGVVWKGGAYHMPICKSPSGASNSHPDCTC